ncbi:MAG: hypothetical protein M9941_17100 [Anaerolineae bacterium]|nr:hypothetical protein [Anaerolineae bacterium]
MRSVNHILALLGVVVLLLSACTTVSQEATPLPLPTATVDVRTLVYPDPVPAPLVTVTKAPLDIVAVDNPGYFAYEIGGRYLENAAFIAGVTVADGQRVVLYEALLPVNDGVNDGVVIWDTQVSYVTDGTAGAFVVPVLDDASGRVAVRGWLQSADSESAATALFDSDGTLIGIQSAESATTAMPQAGSVFIVEQMVFSDDGTFATQPGVRLLANRLLLSREALPGGTVFAGVVAGNLSGAVGQVLIDIAVANDGGRSQAAYLDPQFGFQFRYPADWSEPVYVDSVLTAHSADKAVRLTIRPMPDAESAQQLTDDVLAEWNGVSVLHEDQPDVAGVPGVRTFYGYFDAATVQRTGALLTFLQEDIGFIVDLDGPAADEAAIIGLADELAGSWVQRPLDEMVGTAMWTQQGDLVVPVGFTTSVADRSWQRYTDAADERRFFGVRSDPLTGRTEPGLLTYWRNIAGSNQRDFVTDAPQQVALDDTLWTRQAFAYQGVDGMSMQGALWVQVGDSAETVLWIEAPVAAFTTLEEIALITLTTNR